VVTGYFLLILLAPSGYLGRFLNQLFGITVAFTWKAAVAASAVVSFPLLVRAVRVAVDSVDYKLEEAARLLRASEWEIFFKITLPLAANGIVAGAVLAFARGLGEFGATIIFASNIPGKTQTIPLAIFTYLNQPEGEAKAQMLVLISIVFSYLSILINELLLRRFRNAAS
jgi:molybdate transport system permease protein